MVEVFRTNIDTEGKACFVLGLLETIYPNCMINFDLEDSDNILRMETKDCHIDSIPIIALITHHGYKIEVLPDTVSKTLHIK